MKRLLETKTFKVKADDWETARAKAYRADRTIGEVLREFLREYIQNKKG